MSTYQSEDGRFWTPSVPLPFYYGWRLNKVMCFECRIKFGKDQDAYTEHWISVHT